MRFLSVIIKNYRLHKELKINFNDGLTLIGGVNESGKSTIAEALHRALFLKSKGNTDLHRAMRSDVHTTGDPEVVLEFEQGGKQFKVTKKFGNNGTVSLTEVGGKTVHGEDAENQLSAILHAQTSLKGIEARNIWSHLWNWQGESGKNPIEFAAKHHDDLMKHLNHEGAGAIMQSDRDIRVFNALSSEIENNFKSNGEPRAGSELDQLMRRSQEANSHFLNALSKSQSLDQAAEDYSHASMVLSNIDSDIVEINSEINHVKSRKDRFNELNLQHHRLISERNNAHNGFNIKSGDLQKVLEADSVWHKCQQAILPLQQNHQKKKLELETVRQTLKEVEINSAPRRNEIQVLKNQSEIVSEMMRHEQKVKDMAKLIQKQEYCNALKNDERTLLKERAALPNVTKQALRKIKELDKEKSILEASLRSMSPELTVISAKLKLLINDQHLQNGDIVQIDDVSDLRYGDDLKLRITPGGGEKLEEIRSSHKTALDKLNHELHKLTLRSVEEAEHFHDKIADLSRNIDLKQSELSGLDPEKLQDEIRVAELESETALSRIRRIREMEPQLLDYEPVGDLSNARKLIDKEIESKNEDLIRLEHNRSRLFSKIEILEIELNNIENDIRNIEKDMLLAENTRSNILEKYESIDALKVDIENLDSKTTELQKEAEALQQEIDKTRPESLENDEARLDRALKNKRELRDEMLRKKSGAESLLHSDGQEDPKEVLLKAQNTKDFLDEQVKSLKLRTDAIKLLHNLFKEERERIAILFTSPLAAKVKGYLECIFDPGVKVNLTTDEKSIEAFSVSRTEFANLGFSFEKLSGGAKEQVASAFRLAMAEILAADYGGCLPMIFDDSFVNSDPDRIKNIQRMLDLAAKRGLQIVVLTCNPADYKSLGAKEILLDRSNFGGTILPENGSGLHGDPIEMPVYEPTHPKHANDDINPKDVEEFLLVLKSAGGKAGNATMINLLGWNENRYQGVKSYLLDSGKISTGRGRGGTVMFPEFPSET